MKQSFLCLTVYTVTHRERRDIISGKQQVVHFVEAELLFMNIVEVFVTPVSLPIKKKRRQEPKAGVESCTC